jgi:hypothetical protein
MRCPTCRKDFHPQPDHEQAYWANSPDAMKEQHVESIAVQTCPACDSILVIFRDGRHWRSTGEAVMHKVLSERIVFPSSDNRALPAEIPAPYSQDFVEASDALSYSSKASAALSRRLLQRVLHTQLGIRKRDLSQEIDDFIENAHAPTFLTDAMDAIRNVGNFAAHPIKSTNTGEIVDVEEGEAEWLLETLESLFDFVFVQPIRLKRRQDELNAKLKDLGKPPLKSSRKGKGGQAASDANLAPAKPTKPRTRNE